MEQKLYIQQKNIIKIKLFQNGLLSRSYLKHERGLYNTHILYIPYYKCHIVKQNME